MAKMDWAQWTDVSLQGDRGQDSGFVVFAKQWIIKMALWESPE
jgi:hypothetical protein